MLRSFLCYELNSYFLLGFFPVCIWAVHFLSLSEAVQKKLYEELVEVLGDEPVSLDKIPQLRSVLNLLPFRAHFTRDCIAS